MQLTHRFRRLRRTSALRDMVRETQLSVDDLILPIFIEEGISDPVEIKTLPGVSRYPEEQLPELVQQAWEAGIKSVILFGISHHKDAIGSDTWNEDGLLARMIRSAKEAAPEMVVISDNCFCEYTEHGHCGVICDHDVDNDATLANLQKQVLVAARAGVDMIAPSGMMDGMIAAIREALDANGFEHIPVMSYSTKFSSNFYGPFREAVDSNFNGTRDSYQLDYGNRREALAESLRDVEEGADILMVKPGIAYLDLLSDIHQHTHKPLAVYQVSGEYAMIQFGHQAGAIDGPSVMMESLIAFKRAGADLIITYFALDAAKLLKQ
ncbi:porphobilinogen synthase [Motiliproteus coralliicola]|uniref:Delta-aminolevulinic acid dehydratase n=1 Tax=Motiliproteus coralliicola TaxID=2283196 RepID=A0A369W9N7_9GAMM|nr:porphobilinogen synthase [Motiliproteus coralliicola]RDE18023.1 porphobilinogen synthase [Motiliproteus coralliicola]